MTERRSWLAVVAVYVAIFGAILWTTHGLPYAVDNNESFSSLWHARNLFQTRFALTKGLPDEVAAWHAAASPYIHSHQGDFPRLYSFLLYVLGARSIESQIWLTTFTVGLAAILFAFRFLRTLGPPSFAVICCLVLITDYALLGQWQVNTYRVWYGFFFFSSLLWACRPARLGWGLLNFACLCYGEYVYAAFVCLSAALFAGWLHRREIRLALRAWTAIAGGGAVAAAILAVQLTAYMGWDNVVRDFHYTLTARNVARDADFAAQAAAFYKQHRIIFLQNYLDAAPLRHFSAFASSLYFSHLQFYTPCLCFSALAVLAGAAIARLPRVGPRQILGVALLGAAWICFDKRDTLLQSDFRGSWLAVFPERWSQVVEGAVFFGAALFGLAAAWSGSARLFRAKGRIVHLAALSGCVLGAYAIVYRIFTGYVFSGYLNRQAPFLVFWTDVLLGASIYLIVSAARAQSRAARLGATALAAGFALLWGTAQARYVSAVPPTNYHFLKLLAKPPYRDHSFVTNTYAAPLANQTHSWAYPDKTIFTGRVRLGPHGFEIERDLTYLWFADRDTNPAYAKPDFGMLIAQPSSIAETLLWTLERQGGQARPAIAFGNSGVVGRATSPLQPFLADTFMASDGLQYSIVKFDWDYPPYLKPVGLREPNSSLRARMALTEQTLALHHRWRIRLTVLPRASAPAAPQYVPIDEATIDDRPVFAAEAFRRAGWQGADATRPKVWSVDPALALPLEAYGAGDVVRLRLRSVAGGGRIRIEINDAVETIDLGRLDGAPTEIVLTPAAPYGQHTVVPNFAPGSFVATSVHPDGPRSFAQVSYRFAQQDGKQEANTTIRLYVRRRNDWELADTIDYLGDAGIPVRLSAFRAANPDTTMEYARSVQAGDARSYEEWLAGHLAAHPAEQRRPGIVAATGAAAASEPGPNRDGSVTRLIPLIGDLGDAFQVSVTPATASKTGPEYFGAAFATVGGRPTASAVSSEIGPAKGKAAALPYGILHLQVRFNPAQIGQFQPLVTTGAREAGDVLYFVFQDSAHIRIGLDHWFEGGPLTPLLPVDYEKTHTLDISLGSLYPMEDDILFANMPLSRVERLKHRVVVRLDGDIVLDHESNFYDSRPEQITPGKNNIHATSCGTDFTGQMTVEPRTWPADPDAIDRLVP